MTFGSGPSRLGPPLPIVIVDSIPSQMGDTVVFGPDRVSSVFLFVPGSSDGTNPVTRFMDEFVRRLAESRTKQVCAHDWVILGSFRKDADRSK